MACGNEVGLWKRRGTLLHPLINLMNLSSASGNLYSCGQPVSTHTFGFGYREASAKNDMNRLHLHTPTHFFGAPLNHPPELSIQGYKVLQAPDLSIQSRLCSLVNLVNLSNHSMLLPNLLTLTSFLCLANYHVLTGPKTHTFLKQDSYKFSKILSKFGLNF